MNMHAILVLLLLLNLAMITYHDIRYRSVPVYVFLIAALLSFFIQYERCGMDELFFIQAFSNSIFILANILIVVLYIKKIKKIKIEEAIGAGDLVFYVVLIPLLSTPVFVYFHLTSLFVILILYPVFKNKLSFKTRGIPLAGLQAAYLFCNIIIFEYIIISKPIIGCCAIINWI
jgi:hypothetical protein